MKAPLAAVAQFCAPRRTLLPANADGSRVEGGLTRFQPGGELMAIHAAASEERGVLDWAALKAALSPDLYLKLLAAAARYGYEDAGPQLLDALSARVLVPASLRPAGSAQRSP